MLAETISAMQKVFGEFPVQEAYVVGSLIVPCKFHQHSDIDIAVRGIDNENFFAILSRLNMLLPRMVDIIEIERCNFAETIISKGLKVI